MTVSRKVHPANKLFVIHGVGHLPLFLKALDKEDALLMYEDGWEGEEYKKRISNPNFRCEEVTTLSQLLEFAPDEFTLNDDVAF